MLLSVQTSPVVIACTWLCTGLSVYDVILSMVMGCTWGCKSIDDTFLGSKALIRAPCGGKGLGGARLAAWLAACLSVTALPGGSVESVFRVCGAGTE